MAEAITITAQRREVSPKGRETPKALRRAGYVPGVIYGADFESLSLQFSARELTRVYRRAGSSSLVSLQLEGEESLSAFFREVQRDPVHGQILHVDLYHIVAGQAIHNSIPVFSRGHAPVTELGATVTQTVETIEIECLPKDMPPYLVADLTTLDSISSHLVAGDLQLPDGVTLLSDPEMELFQVNLPRTVLEEEALEGEIEYGEGEEAPSDEDEASTAE